MYIIVYNECNYIYIFGYQMLIFFVYIQILLKKAEIYTDLHVGEEYRA